MISDEKLRELRDMYPNGTKIRLLKTMDDMQPIEAGSCGEVDYVDDAGSIHMNWENGRTLALVDEVDKFEIISKPDKIKEQCPKFETDLDLNRDEMEEIDK